MPVSSSALEQALAEAGRAHHDYETVVLRGVRDELWPGFYPPSSSAVSVALPPPAGSHASSRR